MLKILTVALVGLIVASCTSHPAPTHSLGQPPSQRIKHHTVSRGETLYSIAWRYGQDFRHLAAINGIAAPYSIFPGQRLRLEGKALVSSPRPAPAPVRKSAPAAKPVAQKPSRKVERSLPKKTVRKLPQPVSNSKIVWRWPVRGPLISTFRARDPLRKGVDIAGQKGDSVSAAANGTVIYAGSALRGYGKLLIVKHNEEFLSAYAHNHKLLVKEGSEVKAGQRIAELGSSGTDRNKLHFEIRRNGQPVDPLSYLPRNP
ncbi:peptidase M23 [Microbulbifer flavimaris]|uniref:Peptidase M23 n=1 Tax=Microbulbifer flavimaris TaxID=1781068 RepID=A0ABX4HWY2_9GAMM|nr:peptidase M23 [Microbulbifer sp. ZGT114]PCO04625.1 peptidase M23 [Microbulbifer flavimaris]